MSSLRRLSVLLLAGVLVAGCGETSQVDPDAVVAISGAVLTPAGAPLADRPVRLASADSAGEVALAVVTLGLACTDEVCGDDVRSVVTDAAGAYRVEVRGRDTQTTFGNVRQQVLTASAGPRGDEVSGASVLAQFVVQTEQLALPVLQLVDPALSVTTAPGRVAASWQASAGAPYDLLFESGGTVPVWQVATAETAATLDSRVLEGSRGRVVVSGGTTDEVEGSGLQVTWRSPGAGYASAVGAPLSRGGSCTYEAGSAAPAPCALTDGDLSFAEPPPVVCSSPPAPCVDPTTARITVPDAAPADLVVVRGCEGTCAVEVSTDGTAFRRVGLVSTRYASVRLPRAPVRAVRVGLGDAGLREVSVWGAVPAGQDGLLRLEPAAARDLRRPYAGEPGTGLSTTVLVAAGVLAGGVLLGVAYALGARRGRRRAA